MTFNFEDAPVELSTARLFADYQEAEKNVELMLITANTNASPKNLVALFEAHSALLYAQTLMLRRTLTEQVGKMVNVEADLELACIIIQDQKAKLDEFEHMHRQHAQRDLNQAEKEMRKFFAHP